MVKDVFDIRDRHLMTFVLKDLNQRQSAIIRHLAIIHPIKADVWLQLGPIREIG